MYKAIHLGSFNFGVEDASSLMSILPCCRDGRVDRTWQMAKMAGAKPLHVDPVPGHTLIHMLAVGDYEAYGPNANADAFRKATLDARYKTFEKYGHYYRNHKHDQHFGFVKQAIRVPVAARVDLIVALDNEQCAGELQKIASGQLVPVSMACRLPYDVCSICGHRSKSRADYCDHLKYNLSKIAADGRVVCAFNPGATFFDISSVTVPAFRPAWMFSKVASAAAHVPGGAELAELSGLVDGGPDGLGTLQFCPSVVDRSVLSKLAKLEKRLSGQMAARSALRLVDDDDGAVAQSVAEPMRVLESEDDKLSVLKALSTCHVLLPMSLFVQLLTGKKGVDTSAARTCLPGIFSRMAEQDDQPYIPDLSAASEPSTAVRNAAMALRVPFGVDEPNVIRRTLIIRIRRPRRIVKQASQADAALAEAYAAYQASFVAANTDKKHLIVMANML